MMGFQCIKRILKKIFFLPPVATLLVSIPSYVLVIYTLTGENVNPVLTYVSYFMSAYALIISATGITGVIRLIRKGIDQHPFVKKTLDTPLVGRFLKKDMFRAEIALYQGFFVNLLYAGIKMFSGISYRSVWFVTLAVYYILLALMRASLLHYVRKGGENRCSEWRRYRLCGIILLFMNVALTGIIILVISQNSGFIYPGVLIYVMAMYAFYATITAVWNVIKFRRYGSPVMSAAKVIDLTAALVSMLSRRKTSAAAAYAIVLGVIGTAFMAGSTFAVTAQPPNYILCLLLAIPGFLGWIFPCFLYKKVVGKKAEKIIPLIDAKYDEIYKICEKGNKLLY